jgi:hypothetical protein
MSAAGARLISAAGAAASGGSIVAYVSTGGVTAVAAVPATTIGLAVIGIVGLCGVGYGAYLYFGSDKSQEAEVVIDGTAQDVSSR